VVLDLKSRFSDPDSDRSDVQKETETGVPEELCNVICTADVRCSAPRRSPVVANCRSILVDVDAVDVHANARQDTERVLLTEI